MITNIITYIRAVLIIGLLTGAALLAVEVYFVVTNSNRPDFWPDDGDAPYQYMSSGLFSAYIHDDNPDYENNYLYPCGINNWTSDRSSTPGSGSLFCGDQ